MRFTAILTALSLSIGTLALAQPAPVKTPTVTLPTLGPYPLVRRDVPRDFDRTVLLVLGGVTWHDWERLTRSSGSNVSMPGLRKVLEQGALAAARLPGGPPMLDQSPSPAFMQAHISPALLRAAATLSSGAVSGEVDALPPAAAVTLRVNELWSASAPTYEDAPPAIAYARRVEWPSGWLPNPDALLNMGWGALMTRSADELRGSRLGALGDAIHGAGRRTVALGGADTSLRADRSLPLREWALVAADGRGMVDGGDVSSHLLAPNRTSPFGVCVNEEALLAAFDRELRDPRTALIAVEWGDTRRAALYGRWCAPGIAATHRENALRRADRWIRALVGDNTGAPPRLTQRDRLVVLCVPDLDSNEPQWLPLAYWQPQQGGQGGLLQAKNRGEQPGVVPLESVFSTLVARINAPALPDEAAIDYDEAALIPVGLPSRAADRVGRLLALQAGLAWLDAARDLVHGIWTVFFAGATILSLLLLTRSATEGPTEGPAPFGESSADDSSMHNAPASSRQWPRAWWCATMLLPLLLWLAGLCVEATWRLGAVPGGSSLPGGATITTAWRLPMTLLSVALFILVLMSSARSWFGRVRLHGVRLGLIWMGLTALGLLIGGFSLPWNSLLGTSLLSTAPARSGDIWSLLLISATLLGVAGLTHPTRDGAAPVAPDGSTTELEPDTTTSAAPRRVINLRPAVLWMGVVLLLLGLSGLGRNPAAAMVALIGFGTMWLRLWLERHERPVRLKTRRSAVAVVALLALLLWQRGSAPLIEESLAAWWPGWLATWSLWWWDAALAATVVGAASFLTTARPALRAYVRSRYASRAMLAGASAAALAALLIFGTPGPPLIALYTLGAVLYEALGASRVATA